MIILRRLEPKDAPLMLEWMHDDSTVHDLRTDFMSKTLADCEIFINTSHYTGDNIHLAIADSYSDDYLGTVSLKNIRNGSAEFGIAIRKCAMGTGIALLAMDEVFRIGFEEKSLNSIYWCVSPDNKRALRFYDKNKFRRVLQSDLKYDQIGYSIDEIKSYIWYKETRGKRVIV